MRKPLPSAREQPGPMPGVAITYWNHRCGIAFTIAHASAGVIRMYGAGTAMATSC